MEWLCLSRSENLRHLLKKNLRAEAGQSPASLTVVNSPAANLKRTDLLRPRSAWTLK